LFTPPGTQSSIVSFYHGLDSTTLARELTAAKVPVTFQEKGELLRSAVAMFNNQSDVDQLLGVLSKLV
ncbi:MAG: hypothetical protein VX801_06440, partial [Gemmatimonadota bacterium]|nr:hypothetical protein [Gemmatimonadota bacterium]